MMRGKLPDGFTWRSAQQPSNVYGWLVYLDNELAVIRRLGLGWSVVIDQRFSGGESPVHRVSTPLMGQIWLATWARRQAAFIQVACQDGVSETREQMRSQRLVPLRSSL